MKNTIKKNKHKTNFARFTNYVLLNIHEQLSLHRLVMDPDQMKRIIMAYYMFP